MYKYKNILTRASCVRRARVKMLLIFLAACACGLQATRGLDLPSGDVLVSATAECGVDAADGSPLPTPYRVCGGGPECEQTCGTAGGQVLHSPELAVDGDRNSSWQSPPLSHYLAGGGGPQGEDLTLDLGQAVHVLAVQVWSGDGPLPLNLELHFSLDGLSYKQVTPLSSSGSGGSEVTPLSPSDSGGSEVTLRIVELTSGPEELTFEQLSLSYTRYVRLRFLPPLPNAHTADPSRQFYSVSELQVEVVEAGACPPLAFTPECYGDALIRRTVLPLPPSIGNVLLWRRVPAQSDWWYMDDVTVTGDVCPVGVGECEDGMVTEDFNGTLNSLLWDSASFTDSFPEALPCPSDADPALVVAPGGHVTSRPLQTRPSGVQFDVGFPAPPPFCLEPGQPSEVELRYCTPGQAMGECRLLALVSASECGYCLDQLTFILRYLQEAMSSTIFPSNLTVLEDIRRDIPAVEMEVEFSEGLLLVLEVVFGARASLPPSALPLPLAVPRLDLTFVPAVLTKLQQLRSLLEGRPRGLSLLVDELVAMFEGLQTTLLALEREVALLRRDQEVLSSTVQALLASLASNLDAVLSARAEANLIALNITSRDYTAVEVRVQMVVEAVQVSLATANRFLQLARDNSRHVEEVGAGLVAVEAGLRAAIRLAQQAVGVARDAEDAANQAEDVQEEVIGLLSEAARLMVRGEGVLVEVEGVLASGMQLLLQARELSQNSSQMLPTLQGLVTLLNQSVLSYRVELEPYLPRQTCGNANCTDGEAHAFQLRTTLEIIVNSSVTIYTLQYAREILATLGSSGKPLDLSFINETATLAQQRSLEAIGWLAGVNSSGLVGVASIVLPSAQELRRRASRTLGTTEGLSVSVNRTAEREEELSRQLSEQQLELASLNEGLEGVALLVGLQSEAEQLLARANQSLDRVRDTSDRVERVRVGTGEVRSALQEIRTNVAEAEEALQEAEGKFPLISRFLEATRRQAQAAIFNASSFVAENERIVGEIDSLIANLADVHSSIGRVNSPVRLASDPASDAVPYLSLQPPPSRQLEGVVQFEDLDLYLWPSAQYQTPALLFYAGPVRFPGQQNRTEPRGREDSVWVVAEEDGLHLGWELDGFRGNIIHSSGRVEGNSQLRLVRMGSQFGLEFTPSAEVARHARLANGSLLFHNSDRTAFLLGGWPPGAELGPEKAPLPLSSLHGFEGQYQLALFNGDLWGLWNVRSSSNTDLIGNREFRRSQLATATTWHGPRGFSSTASTLSFDGTGYLFTSRFGNDNRFSRSFSQQFVMFMRPNDESHGLVMYAYQPQESLSLEVCYRSGQLQVLLTRHDLIGEDRILINHTEPASRAEETQLVVLHVSASNMYRVNNMPYPVEAARRVFFTNLRQVRAWFGGVQEDMVESPYIPLERSSYFGCVDMYVQKDASSVADIFRGSSFTANYLNSPVQRGFSATCYSSVYAQLVSFGPGAGRLAYTFLPLPPQQSSGERVTFSLSFLPLEANGVLLVAVDEGNLVYAALRDGVVEVVLEDGSGAEASLAAGEGAALGEWHHMILDLQLPTDGPNRFSLFLDDLLRDEASPALPDFSLSFPTSAPVGVANPPPILYVGGVSPDVISDPLPTFTGCLRDLTFGLTPIGFLATSLVERYPPGVTYHSCPALPVAPVPELPVSPAPPEPRVCLPAVPVELNNTHGGFHRDTRLTTSNVLGLQGRRWTLSLSVRQLAAGHLLSVRGAAGERVVVEVGSEGELTLRVRVPEGEERNVSSLPLPPNVFTPVTISCSLFVSNFLCLLTVGGSVSPQLQLPHGRANLFDPLLPIALGQTEDGGAVVEGFEGCVADLAINRDTSGFIGVSTGIPCYERTLPGLGFTGASRIVESLPSPASLPSGEVSVSLSVRPLLETGLLLMLTANDSTPVLAVGLLQGRLRVSNFSGSTLPQPESPLLCDPTNVVTFDLQLNYSESLMSVSVGGVLVTLAPPTSTPALGELQLSIGNVPGDFRVPAGSSLFSFLLSEDVNPSSLPAGLVGCLTSSSLLGQPLSLASVDSVENVLDGFCPDG